MTAEQAKELRGGERLQHVVDAWGNELLEKFDEVSAKIGWKR